ncbi:MAG: hypothetical protein N2510_06630 [Ignavibacteria bacterium]|nr:hypothetical protein [Ignavibacteria bacterium]
MEPVISNSESHYQGQKIYGRKSGCAKFGLIGLFFSVFIFAGIAVLAYFVILPALNIPLPFIGSSGNLLDATIAPSKDGYRIWVLADGSINYIKEVSTPGSKSIGRHCKDCKTWTYVYDKDGNELHKIKTEQKDILTITNIEYMGGKVWTFIEGYRDNEPKIETYDPETGDKTSDTDDFIRKYSELSAGIAEMSFDGERKLLKLKTKDGRNLLFNPETEKISNEKESKSLIDSSIVTRLILGSEEGSSERKILYKVTGPKSELENDIGSRVNNPSALKFFYNAVAEQIGGPYIEGIVYHSDDDCAIIIHLDQIGKKANRMMTCVDSKTGKELWTVKSEDMFDEMKIDENKDSFSSLFLTKDKIGVNRRGDLVVLHFQYAGIIIFDYKTGKKIKEIEV